MGKITLAIIHIRPIKVKNKVRGIERNKEKEHNIREDWRWWNTQEIYTSVDHKERWKQKEEQKRLGKKERESRGPKKEKIKN